MRLYAIALITWAAILTVSTESNIANLSNVEDIDYTEFRDSSVKQIVQPYVSEAKSSKRVDIEDHFDGDEVELSRSAIHTQNKAGSNGVFRSDSSSSESHTAPFIETTDKYSFLEYSPNRKSGYTIPEDVFLIENAGNFGQRVRQDVPNERMTTRITIKPTDSGQDHDQQDRQVDNRQKYASFGKAFSSTTSLPEKNDDNSEKAYVSSTRESFVFVLKKESDLIDDSLLNKTEASRSKISIENTDGILDAKFSTENSSFKKDVASVLENDVVPEYLPTPQARSSRMYNDTKDTYDDTTKNAAEPVKNSERIATSTSVEISPSLQLTKFSGPIVVPDLPYQETPDMIIDYMDDDTDPSGTLSSMENAEFVPEIAKVENSKVASISSSKTASSIMLNPLQVGITLMNADEASLVDDSEHSAATETKDYLQDEPEILQVDKKFIENKGNQSDVNYKKGNFQREISDENKATEIVTQKVPVESSVEIQKSIELYHTAPVHEIHYPVEYIQQTSHLGVIETNNIGNIGNVQKSKQPYDQNERNELRPNYDIYRGNDAEKSVIKTPAASALLQKFNRQEYNALEDDIGQPVASALIAEYSSSTDEAPFENPIQPQQQQQQQYSDVKPVLLVANQFDDALYEQSNTRHVLNGNDNGASFRTKFTGSPARQGTVGELVKPYITSTYQEQQPQLGNQLIDSQHSYRSPLEARRQEATQLLLKIIPNGSSAETGFLVPFPRPHPLEKIVEKTVHVPHPIEIEKVIEKKVPFPVERVVEKQVPVPVLQPYPVHVPVDRVAEKQIRVPHLYPIHIERVIEKRIPYAIQRLLVQPPPYPLHTRLAYSTHAPLLIERPTHVPAPIEQPIHVPVSIERPTHVPAPVEKTVEKSVASSRPLRPFRGDLEKLRDNGGDSIETKFHKYHQRLHQSTLVNENAADLHTDVNNVAFESQQSQVTNASQFFGDPYGRLSTFKYNVDGGKNYVPTAHLSNVKLMILPKKFGSHQGGSHHVMLRPQTIAPPYAVLPVSLRQQIVYNLVEKDNALKDEYLGPVPPRKVFSSQAKIIPSAKSPLFSTLSVTQSPTTIATLRRVRQPEAQFSGSFRQSKMEYGFKPPMVPSVQYDENTASKVEN